MGVKMAKVCLASKTRHFAPVLARLQRDGHSVELVQTPEALSSPRLQAMAPDWVFFTHWSWKIPPQIYQTHRCVIFHMTDVPYGRGGSPMQNLIARGHTSTKLSALVCTDEIDSGDVYLKRDLDLSGTADEILARAGQVMADMAAEIAAGGITPQPQQGEPVVFKRRSRDDGNLAHAAEPREAYDLIRMLDGEGYPAAFLETGHLKIEFYEADMQGETVHARVRVTRKP
jgi:methionyl-tRNA formyltransferase